MDPSFGLFGGRPRLPRECSCGNTQDERCNEAGLLNHHNYPPFAYLQDENDIDLRYYGQDDTEFMYSPIRHWALVGEIVDINFFIRPRVTIQTRFGEKVLVNFHLEDANKPTFFDWTDLQRGACLIIFYAKKRTFLDMNQGVRQESPDSVMLFPAGFRDLVNEVQGYSNPNSCSYCGKPETTDHKLCRCKLCRVTRYCGRECQAPHWKKSHKKLCRHATMLSSLATLDFSTFNNFIDWNFVIEDPPTREEKEQKSKKAARDMLYEMGVQNPELSSMPARLETLLSAIENKSMEADTVTKKYLESSMFIRKLKQEDPEEARCFSVPVGETFLVQSLCAFLEAVKGSPDLRSHVVDLNLPRSMGGFVPGHQMSHFVLEEVLDCMFFALPIWQHEESIGDISWAVESHAVFERSKSLYEDNRRVWDIPNDDGPDALIVKNRVSGTCFFAYDNTETVARIGEHLAKARPNETVIRVLRATANESWADTIRRIATKQDVPDNVYTLWIREEVPLCGRFNPPREQQSLVEKLLDRERISHTDLLLRALGKTPANILHPREASFEEDEEDQQVDRSLGFMKCASCSVRKSRASFSKNQRRTKGALARCKECIHG